MSLSCLELCVCACVCATRNAPLGILLEVHSCLVCVCVRYICYYFVCVLVPLSVDLWTQLLSTSFCSTVLSLAGYSVNEAAMLNDN